MKQYYQGIIKYTGEKEMLEKQGISVTPLMGGYGIVEIPEDQIDDFLKRPQILDWEIPGISCKCIDEERMWTEVKQMRGKGVLLACIDSGVDIFHEEFRKKDGQSRIFRLWDQTKKGKTPKGYRIGKEYTKEEIDEILQKKTKQNLDTSGHGTAVLSIAGGTKCGIAPECDLLVVKLAKADKSGNQRISELMQGVDYAIGIAKKFHKPLVINISFGMNEGAHNGRGFVETYLDQVSQMWKTIICVGSGNCGEEKKHTEGKWKEGEKEEIAVLIGNYETDVELQLWKRGSDRIKLEIEAPSGKCLKYLVQEERMVLQDTYVRCWQTDATPHQRLQKICFQLKEKKGYIDAGVWKIFVVPEKIVDGRYACWLLGENRLGPETCFKKSVKEHTKTIPATARRVLSVAAACEKQEARFSGRTADMMAPGVEVFAAKAGGGYTKVTGTSFATPYGSGIAARMMEWGIVRGKDYFLYGEKLKSYLCGKYPVIDNLEETGYYNGNENMR